MRSSKVFREFNFYLVKKIKGDVVEILVKNVDTVRAGYHNLRASKFTAENFLRESVVIVDEVKPLSARESLIHKDQDT